MSSSRRDFLERELERVRRTLHEYRLLLDHCQNMIHRQLHRNFALEEEIRRLNERMVQDVPVFRSNRDERKFSQELHNIAARLQAAHLELRSVREQEIPRLVTARNEIEDMIK